MVRDNKRLRLWAIKKDKCFEEKKKQKKNLPKTRKKTKKHKIKKKETK